MPDTISEFSISKEKLARQEERGLQLLQDLQNLVPSLRDRGHATEEAGRISDESINDLKRIDAFRAVVPESYGGMEVPFPIIPQIFRYLGRGCMSTGWSMGFLIYHNFQFAHYPRELQDITFGTRGYTMAAGQVIPSGEAKRVDGGFILNGRWGYATGIFHSDYMALAAPVIGEKTDDDKPIMYRFAVPTEKFEILDTWHVAAMKATGSHDVTLTDVFVPDYHGVPVEALRERTSPGLDIHPGPLWRVPLLSFMSFGAVGPMVGGADAMLEMVTNILETKVGAYSGDRQQDLMTQRVRIAGLTMEHAATVGLFEDKINELWAMVVDGEAPSREKRTEMRIVVSYVARKCHQLVNELALAAGSRGNYVDSPIQRFQRDVNALATHAIFEYDHTANLFGATLLGQDVPKGAMI